MAMKSPITTSLMIQELLVIQSRTFGRTTSARLPKKQDHESRHRFEEQGEKHEWKAVPPGAAVSCQVRADNG